MMIGPMKKKVITASVVTSLIFIVIFGVTAFVYVSFTNKQIGELKLKGEVVQRYVFTKNLTSGTVVQADDIKYVDVKGESAPSDSFEYKEEMRNGVKSIIDKKTDILGRRLRVNVNEKTIVTESMFYADDKVPNLDTRVQEYNMVTLPSDLKEGDYVDIRIRFATGEDYSVLIGKKIEGFGARGSESNTIFLRLNEEEIVRMSSAIIESYINDGINLYANKYVDPSNQLFEYKYEDLVEKFESVRYIEGEPEYEIVSGEYVEKPSKSTERTNAEIATLLGIDVNDVAEIKEAVDKKDEETLKKYRNRLITTEKSINPTYPVKTEVAALIKNNPNILSDVKAKYNVETLMEERANFVSTALTVKDEYTGEEKNHEDHITHLKENLDKEITAQRSERQEYLLNLMSKQATTNN